jgi:demethylmenaquinone methyltransferase/2-methoxy-6-polyprenyl-1,4-benzoquinol methylase
MTTKVTPEPSQIAAMFDRVAPRYDFLNRLLSLGTDMRWRKKLMEQMPVTVNGKYLDVATGTGDLIYLALKKRPMFSRYTGLDISTKMLEQAEAKRKKSKKETYGKTVEFIEGSATKLPFAESSFNCASIAFGLRNIADRQTALRELSRVLTPAGKLFVLEFFPPKDTLMARLFGWYFNVVLPRVAGIFSDAAAYKYLPQSVAQMPKPESFAKLVNAEGFDILDNRAFIFGHCRLYQLYKRTT